MTALKQHYGYLPTHILVGDRAYLLIHLTDCGEVIVSPSPGRHLNRFWTVWLEHNLLNQNEHIKVACLLEDNQVKVTSASDSDSLGLFWAVYRHALRIRPMPSPPMNRRRFNTSTQLIWDLRPVLLERFTDGAGLLEQISLPRNGKLEFVSDFGGALTLTRIGGMPSLSTMGKMVEWQIAKLCA